MSGFKSMGEIPKENHGMDSVIISFIETSFEYIFEAHLKI